MTKILIEIDTDTQRVVPLVDMIEVVARYIYMQWLDAPGYVTWIPGGNSLMQDSARRIAATALDAAIAAAPQPAPVSPDANECRLTLIHQIHELSDHIERGAASVIDKDMRKQMLGQREYALRVSAKWNMNGNPFAAPQPEPVDIDLRRDAERYRWLRKALSDRSMNGRSHHFCSISEGHPEELNKEIDAAMAQGEQK